MTRKIVLGRIRTGEILVDDLPWTDASYSLQLRGDDTAEVSLPSSYINVSDLSSFFRTMTRFIAFIDTDAANPVVYAGPIIKKRDINEKGEVGLICGSMKDIMATVPAIPIEFREKVESRQPVWDLNGAPSYVMGQILNETLAEVNGYKFVRSIPGVETPAGENNGFGFLLSPFLLKTVSDIINVFLDDPIRGVECRFVPRFKAGTDNIIEWPMIVQPTGQRHYNKDAPIIDVSLDYNEKGGNLAYTRTGDRLKNANWWYGGSETKFDDVNQLDLISKKAEITDPEDFHRFKSINFDTQLTTAEIIAQLTPRVAEEAQENKVWSVSMVNNNSRFFGRLGTQVKFHGSTRIKNIEDTVRIAEISGDFSSMQVDLKVQPANLIVYPELPPRNNDEAIKDAINDIPKAPGGANGAGGSDGETPEIPPFVPPTWGDGSKVQVVGDHGMITTEMGDTSSIVRWNDYVYGLDYGAMRMGANDIGTPWRVTTIKRGTISGKNVTGVVDAGTIPTSVMGEKRSDLLQSSGNVIVYRNDAFVLAEGPRAAEYLWGGLYVANNRLYSYWTHCITFATTDRSALAGTRFNSFIMYTDIKENGMLGDTWSTAKPFYLSSDIEDQEGDGKPKWYYPLGANIANWGPDGTSKVAFFSCEKYGNWTKNALSTIEYQWPVSKTCMVIDYTNNPAGDEWKEIKGPLLEPVEDNPGGLETPFLNAIAVDGYIYCSNFYYYDFGTKRPDGTKIWRARADGDNIGPFKIFAQTTVTNKDNNYRTQTWLAKHKGRIVASLSTIYDSGKNQYENKFLYHDDSQPGDLFNNSTNYEPPTGEYGVVNEIFTQLFTTYVQSSNYIYTVPGSDRIRYYSNGINRPASKAIRSGNYALVATVPLGSRTNMWTYHELLV